MKTPIDFRIIEPQTEKSLSFIFNFNQDGGLASTVSNPLILKGIGAHLFGQPNAAPLLVSDTALRRFPSDPIWAIAGMKAAGRAITFTGCHECFRRKSKGRMQPWPVPGLLRSGRPISMA